MNKPGSKPRCHSLRNETVSGLAFFSSKQRTHARAQVASVAESTNCECRFALPQCTFHLLPSSVVCVSRISPQIVLPTASPVRCILGAGELSDLSGEKRCLDRRVAKGVDLPADARELPKLVPDVAVAQSGLVDHVHVVGAGLVVHAPPAVAGQTDQAGGQQTEQCSR